MDISWVYALTWIPVLWIYAYFYPSGRVRSFALVGILVSRAAGLPWYVMDSCTVLSGFPVARQTRRSVAMAGAIWGMACVWWCPPLITCTLHMWARDLRTIDKLAACCASMMLYHCSMDMAGMLCLVLIIIKHSIYKPAQPRS